MPNLLIVTTVPSTLKAFLLPFSRHFRARGWRVDAAANGLSLHTDLGDGFDAMHDLSLARSFRNPWGLLKALGQLRRLCEKNEYDLVHVHTPIAGFVTRFALRRLRAAGSVKVVYTAHGFHFFEGAKRSAWLVYGLAERLAGRWTDRLVVINEEDLTLAKRWRIVREGGLVAMPGIGVDRDFYGRTHLELKARASVRRDLGIAQNAFLILVVAELSLRKRQEDVLKALASSQDNSTNLLLVGEGPARDRLESLTLQLGLASRVQFLGFRRDIPALMSAADLLMLPSSQEGLPRCVLEAMTAGLPAAASNVRGSRDLLGDGCGWLFEVGDTAGIWSVICQVRSNSAEAQRRVANAQLAVRTRYDLNEIIRAHESLYASVLESLPGKHLKQVPSRS